MTEWPDWQEISEQARREWEKIEEDIRQRVQSKFQQRQLLREEAEDLALLEVPPQSIPTGSDLSSFDPFYGQTRCFTRGGTTISIQTSCSNRPGRGWPVCGPCSGRSSGSS